MTVDNLYLVVAGFGLLAGSWYFALAWVDTALPVSDKIAATWVAAVLAVTGAYGLGRGLMLW